MQEKQFVSWLKTSIVMALVGLLLVACGSAEPVGQEEPAADESTVEKEVEVTTSTEDIVAEPELEVEVEVEAEPFLTPSPLPTGPRATAVAQAENVVGGTDDTGDSDALATGQESSQQPTPQPFRDKSGSEARQLSDSTVASSGDTFRSEADTPTPQPIVQTSNETIAAPTVPPVSPTPTVTIQADSAEPIAPSTPLAAGVRDDNVAWDSYTAYLASAEFSAPGVLTRALPLRQQLSVVDANGQPLSGANVEIASETWIAAQLRTHADGGAWFLPTDLLETIETLDVKACWRAVCRTNTWGQLAENNWTVSLDVMRDGQTQLDVAIVFDTTGSMGNELAALQDNIGRIVDRISQSPTQPDTRLALIAYRDQTDHYLTHITPFTRDITAFSEQLNQLDAAGGGDYPEALQIALEQSLQTLDWRGSETIRLLFIVTDAPPQLDDTAFNYLVSADAAASAGIRIYPIATTGIDDRGEYIYRQLAQLTGGQYIFLTDSGDTGDDGTSADGLDATESAEVEPFTVGALDDIVVEIIEGQLAFQE